MEISVDRHYYYDGIVGRYIEREYGDFHVSMTFSEAQIIRKALEYYTEKRKIDFRERMEAGRLADEIRDAKETRIEHEAE